MSAENSKLKATFDYSKVGRTWQNKFAETADNVAQIIVMADRPLRRQRPDEGNQEYDDYVDTFYEKKKRMGAEIRQQAEIQAAMVADVLRDVPREWLLPDAPESIDWSKPDNLDYIQAPYYAEILEQVRSGEAMKKAKNSVGHSQ